MTRALARAKLTLSLRVLGRRPDGYHDLEALAVSLTDPHDVVEVELAPAVSLVVDGPAAGGVSTGDDNLAVRAARSLGTGLQLRLTKRIPAGAGLGGGSADAAATLVVGARLLGLTLDLVPLAAELGSDVPFCLAGGAAWMRGRGEVIEPVPSLPPLSFAVVVPPFSLSTAAVYQAWDDLGGPHSDRAVVIPGLPELVNDLEPAAEAVEPRLRPFREALEALAGAPALLAGSGSAYALVVDSAEQAVAIAADAASMGTTFAAGVLCGHDPPICGGS